MSVPSFSFLRCFASLKDPRVRGRTDHLLLDIVAIALCAVIAEADNRQQVAAFGIKRRDWLHTVLQLPNGIPSHDTFERVFQRLDPCAFQRCLLGWRAGWPSGWGPSSSPSTARRRAGRGGTRRGWRCCTPSASGPPT